MWFPAAEAGHNKGVAATRGHAREPKVPDEPVVDQILGRPDEGAPRLSSVIQRSMLTAGAILSRMGTQ